MEKKFLVLAVIVWFSALQIATIYYLREIEDDTRWLSDINHHLRNLDPNPY